jgi:FKBP-type peptidyl-prolyl cis-trans isomerase (trigger factor)
VYNIVQENTKRGVGRELIEQQKEEIYSAAARSAKDRVKLSFLIRRIAAQEKIQATQEEVVRRVEALAQAYQIPVEKFIKDLQKRDGVNEIYEQIIHEKVVQFLEQNAAYEEVPAR